MSTRKVKAITEELCGHTFSASTVSRINTGLDELLRRFAQRRLEEACPYVILDARYEKVRLDGVIQSQAVFIALGINWEGRRQVLGVELSTRESQSSWTTFVNGLQARGLRGVEFVVSDDHAGIKRAVRELLPEAVWQRCYVHFLRNALDYLPRKADDCTRAASAARSSPSAHRSPAAHALRSTPTGPPRHARRVRQAHAPFDRSSLVHPRRGNHHARPTPHATHDRDVALPVRELRGRREHRRRAGDPWRCCTNRPWPARCPPRGSSPADAIRHWSAEGGHPIEDLTAEDDLTPLPSWTPGAKAIADDGLVAEERVLHPALTMVP